METTFRRFGIRTDVYGGWIAYGDVDYRRVERLELMSSDYDVVVDEYETVKSYNYKDDLLRTDTNWVGSHTETRSDLWTRKAYDSVRYIERIIRLDNGDLSSPFDDEGLKRDDRVHLVHVRPGFPFQKLDSWHVIPANLRPRPIGGGRIRNLISRIAMKPARQLAREDRISILSRISRDHRVSTAYDLDHMDIGFSPLWVEGGVARNADGGVVRLPRHDGRDGFVHAASSDGRIIAWHAATDAAWMRTYRSHVTPWGAASFASWSSAAALLWTGHPFACDSWIIPAPFILKFARDLVVDIAKPRWGLAMALAGLAGAAVWKAYQPAHSAHMLCAFGAMVLGYVLWAIDRNELAVEGVRTDRAGAALRSLRRATMETARHAAFGSDGADADE